MDRNDIIEKIKALEQSESYFGIISQLSAEKDIHLKTAWAIVEQERKELGLRPRYRTYPSFYNARSNHHAIGGEIVRINPPEETNEK